MSFRPISYVMWPSWLLASCPHSLFPPCEQLLTVVVVGGMVVVEWPEVPSSYGTAMQWIAMRWTRYMWLAMVISTRSHDHLEWCLTPLHPPMSQMATSSSPRRKTTRKKKQCQWKSKQNLKSRSFCSQKKSMVDIKIKCDKTQWGGAHPNSQRALLKLARQGSWSQSIFGIGAIGTVATPTGIVTMGLPGPIPAGCQQVMNGWDETWGGKAEWKKF